MHGLHIRERGYLYPIGQLRATVPAIKEIPRRSDIMTNGMPATATPRDEGLVRGFTRAFEMIGLLNKGSSKTAATPSRDAAANVVGVGTNSMNATRVGGLAATVTAVGAAALAIFRVKASTKAPVAAAAYASVGVIVAAALLTAAIIVSADIKNRSAVAVAQARPAPAAETTGSFAATWNDVLQRLKGAFERFGYGTEDLINVWLDASGTGGLTADLTPPKGQSELHAKLQACQARIVSRFEVLIDEPDKRQRRRVSVEIQALLDSMNRMVPVGGS